MIEIKKATKESEYAKIEQLAREIYPEVYGSMVPHHHIFYFVDNFQSKEAIDRQVDREGFQYYLLNFNGEAVGYIGVQLLADKMELSKLYVLSSHRGKRIGTKALEFVDKLVVKEKKRKIELEVVRQNKQTIAIYQKHGYRIAEAVIDSYANGYSLENFRMEKVVNTSSTDSSSWK